MREKTDLRLPANAFRRMSDKSENHRSNRWRRVRKRSCDIKDCNAEDSLPTQVTQQISEEQDPTRTKKIKTAVTSVMEEGPMNMEIVTDTQSITEIDTQSANPAVTLEMNSKTRREKSSALVTVRTASELPDFGFPSAVSGDGVPEMGAAAGCTKSADPPSPSAVLLSLFADTGASAVVLVSVGPEFSLQSTHSGASPPLVCLGFCTSSVKLISESSFGSDGPDVAESAKSLSPSAVGSSLLLGEIALVPLVFGDGEATGPGWRSLAILSSSKANQLEFVNRDPL
nr:hypothetical protein Iba_chr06dCG10100 [Ipomoea batatas]